MGMVFRKRYSVNGEIRTCKTWTIRYYNAAGKQMEEATGSESEREARRILAKREGDKAAGLPVGPEIGRIRFDEAVSAVYQNYGIKGRRSLADVKRRVKLHLAPFFGNRRMVEIGTPLMRLYTAQRLQAGASPATVRLELAILRRAFRLAFAAGQLSRVPYIEMPTVNNARQGFFEADQVAALLQRLPADIASVIRFAYVTGWRVRSEVFALQWRQVDLQAGELGEARLEPGTTKNGEGRTFSLTPALRTVLKGQLAIHEAFKAAGKIVPWVFPTLKGQRFKWVPRDTWAAACKAAGCPGRMPHDLRRTAVRNLVRAGVSEKVAMTMTGHKTRSVFERYNIISSSDQREAARKLAAVTDAVIEIAIAGNQTTAETRNSTQHVSRRTLGKSTKAVCSAAS